MWKTTANLDGKRLSIAELELIDNLYSSLRENGTLSAPPRPNEYVGTGAGDPVTSYTRYWATLEEATTWKNDITSQIAWYNIVIEEVAE